MNKKKLNKDMDQPYHILNVYKFKIENFEKNYSIIN